MIDFFFYFFAAVAVISAGIILFTTNLLYAAFALVATFLCVAGLYIIAGAEFVGITQIMVYVGGIVVLLIFGVMLTNRLTGESIKTHSRNRFFGTLVMVGMSILLITGITRINFTLVQPIKAGERFNNVEQLGIGLMSDYLLPFEVAAVLLLVALVGAATIAGYKQKSDG